MISAFDIGSIGAADLIEAGLVPELVEGVGCFAVPVGVVGVEVCAAFRALAPMNALADLIEAEPIEPIASAPNAERVKWLGEYQVWRWQQAGRLVWLWSALHEATGAPGNSWPAWYVPEQTTQTGYIGGAFDVATVPDRHAVAPLADFWPAVYWETAEPLRVRVVRKTGEPVQFVSDGSLSKWAETLKQRRAWELAYWDALPEEKRPTWAQKKIARLAGCRVSYGMDAAVRQGFWMKKAGML